MILNFIFNDISSSEYGIVGSPQVAILPERRKNKIVVPGRDGAFDFGGDSFEPRIIPVDCFIRAASEAELLEKLAAAALWLTGDGYLILGRAPEKRWKAKLYEGVDLEKAAKTGRFLVAFECDPPWPEDIEAQTGAIGTAQDYGSPLPFAPVITATMSEAATYLQVQHLESSRFIRLQSMPSLPLALAIDDEVIIDIGAGMVTRNGVSVKANISLASLFFMVPRGDQTILLTTDGAAEASMEYRRRWLYA